MSFCTAQLSPAQSFWRTKPNSNKASAQVNSISTAACRCHRRHLPPVIAPLRFCRPRLGDTLMASPPPVATAGPHSVFVYGTLMEEEVVRVLLGRAPPSSSPALLPDHRRFSLRGRVYPAILPARAHAVSGKVRVRLSLSSCQP
jgi:hypothetical protein